MSRDHDGRPVRHLHAAGAGHSGRSDISENMGTLLATEAGRPDPEPVGVSFRQTAGVRMVYVSLALPLGSIARSERVCDSPQISLDYDSHGRVVGLEILA